MKLTERELASWLLGHHAAMRGRVPGWHRESRATYLTAIRTAREVMTGGAFNPLLAWEMFATARRGIEATSP